MSIVVASVILVSCSSNSSAGSYSSLERAELTLRAATNAKIAECLSLDGFPGIAEEMKRYVATSQHNGWAFNSRELGPRNQNEAKELGIFGQVYADQTIPPGYPHPNPRYSSALDSCQQQRVIGESLQLQADIAKEFNSEKYQRNSFVSRLVSDGMPAMVGCMKAVYPDLKVDDVFAGKNSLESRLGIRFGNPVPPKIRTQEIDGIKVDFVTEAATYEPTAKEQEFALVWADCSRKTMYSAHIEESVNNWERQMSVTHGAILARLETQAHRLEDALS